MAERNTPRRCGSCTAETPSVAAALAAGWTGGKGRSWCCKQCDDKRRHEEAERRLARRVSLDRDPGAGPPQDEPLDHHAALSLLWTLALAGRMRRMR